MTIQPPGSILELCHVTDDMDAAIAHWTELFGAGPFYVFDIPALPGQRYRGAPTTVDLRIAFGFSGGLLIELLQQTNDVPSVFQEMLAARGAGWHHLMPRLDFDDGSRRFAAKGYEVAFSGTMPGGERFAIFDTRDDNGGYVELMDLTEATFGPMAAIHQAHLDWDGKTDPKRDFFSLAKKTFVAAEEHQT